LAISFSLGKSARSCAFNFISSLRHKVTCEFPMASKKPDEVVDSFRRQIEAQKADRARVLKEELVDRDTRFLAVYVEAKNSCLVLLSEKEDKLGTLAIAVPKPKDFLGTASSSVLLGDRNVISARMFAEYIAAKKNKIAMVSVYLDQMTEMEAQSFFMKLLEKVTQVESEKDRLKT